ncbi:MAG: hypothetical protein QOH41_2788 [Blastocatellia bacterium]|nr:hypothetical protein [Blastocatellia bacterium]
MPRFIKLSVLTRRYHHPTRAARDGNRLFLECGGSTPLSYANRSAVKPAHSTSAARFAGLFVFSDRFPGAYAPGFMLSPASRVFDARRFSRSHEATESHAPMSYSKHVSNITFRSLSVEADWNSSPKIAATATQGWRSIPLRGTKRNNFSGGHSWISPSLFFLFFTSPLPIHPRRQNNPSIPTATTIMMIQTV